MIQFVTFVVSNKVLFCIKLFRCCFPPWSTNQWPLSLLRWRFEIKQQIWEKGLTKTYSIKTRHDCELWPHFASTSGFPFYLGYVFEKLSKQNTSCFKSMFFRCNRAWCSDGICIAGKQQKVFRQIIIKFTNFWFAIVFWSTFNIFRLKHTKNTRVAFRREFGIRRWCDDRCVVLVSFGACHWDIRAVGGGVGFCACGSRFCAGRPIRSFFRQYDTKVSGFCNIFKSLISVAWLRKSL